MNEQPVQPIRQWPAARGLGWVSGSWELFRRQPLRLLLISLFFQFFLSFSQVNVLGLLVILCLPVFSAGMLHAFLLVERYEKPSLAVLFLPFTAKNSITRLLLLGGVVMALGLLVVTLILAGQAVDINPEILSRIEQGDLDALQLIDPQMMENTIMAMALAATISGIMTYFSVPLIWFKKMGTGGAVTMGLKALGLNWRPLLVIGILLGFLAVPIALLFVSFYLSALSDGTASTWVAFLLLLLGPMFQLMLFGTQYMAFKDIFGLDEMTGGDGKNRGDQLVA